MTYKQEVAQYKDKAITIFQGHISDLEKNIIKRSKDVEKQTPVSELYIDYQKGILKLIEGKLRIDNEFLKQISITSLEKYVGLDTEQFSEIQGKVLENHKRIIKELKTEYEQIALASREHVKLSLATSREDNDLNVSQTDTVNFFPPKMSIISANFILVLIIFVLIIGSVYYINFL